MTMGPYTMTVTEIKPRAIKATETEIKDYMRARIPAGVNNYSQINQSSLVNAAAAKFGMYHDCGDRTCGNFGAPECELDDLAEQVASEFEDID